MQSELPCRGCEKIHGKKWKAVIGCISVPFPFSAVKDRAVRAATTPDCPNICWADSSRRRRNAPPGRKLRSSARWFCQQLMETTAAAPGQGQEQRDSPREIAEIQKVFLVRVICRVSLKNSRGKGFKG